MVTASDMIRRKVYFTVFTPIQPTMRSDKKASVAAHIIMFADNKVSSPAAAPRLARLLKMGTSFTRLADSPEDAPRFARLLKMGTSLCAHLILIPI